MDLEATALGVLVLGLLLGLKHATDADHVVAVTTIVNEYKNAFKGIWVGVSWGLGHTLPLLILGTVILLFKDLVMDSYEEIAPVFEFGVGVMLVFLGAQVFWNLYKKRLHVHHHQHDGDQHLHIHGAHDESEDPSIEKSHSLFNPGKPFFRFKSFVIGLIHGMAGSAAVMLALLATIDSFFVGFGYLILFGVGTVISMALITVLLSLPFVISNKTEKFHLVVNAVAGTISAVFGFALMSDIALGTQLIPF